MCGNCHGGDVFVGMVTQVSHRFQYWYTALADIKFCFQTMYKANSQYSVYPYSLDTEEPTYQLFYWTIPKYLDPNKLPCSTEFVTENTWHRRLSKR